MPDSHDKGKAPRRSDKPEDVDISGANNGTHPSLDSNPSSATKAHTTDTTGGSKRVPPKMIESLVEQNPALKHELASMDEKTAAATLANMDISQLLTGLSLTGKNQKDMASYKFWQTQPVPSFDDSKGKKSVSQGPIKVINPDEVPKTPGALIEGFEWCTLDLTDPEELKELYELLNNHYVEDDNAMFRFSYSESFLHWYVPQPLLVPAVVCAV